jgi:8-oxo-dGTP pyrophosphatase MutT (NUDIX family)
MEPVFRRAARIVLIDPDDRVLLLLTRYRPGVRLWITPGGGIEPGESAEEAACRELREETGIDATPGACVWVRRHTFDWKGVTLDEHESFFVVRLAHAPATTDAHLLDHERDFIREYRWWTVDEITASSDWFAPRRIADLLPTILAGDYPAAPIDCGV